MPMATLMGAPRTLLGDHNCLPEGARCNSGVQEDQDVAGRKKVIK